MRRIESFWRNPFDDAEISLAELAAYSTDHLQRMSANNPDGDLTDRIAATTAAVAALEDAFAADLTKLGLRKARKQAKDDFRGTLATAVGKIVVAVEYEFGEGSTQVTEVIPQGRTAFNRSRDDQVLGHLETLLTGVTAHQAELGVEIVTDATALRDSWQTIYTASETATGEKVATEEQQRQVRSALQRELYVNLLTLVILYPDQPEMATLMMQQSLLENPQPAEPPASSSSSS